MGYNLSRYSVNRNLPQLDLLLTAKGDIRFETNAPRKLCYKLREALTASNEFSDLKHYYNTINPTFTFKEEPDAVIAVYNFVSPGVPIGEMDVRQTERPSEQKGTVESARTMLDVIGGGIEGDKEGYIDILFPNAVLSKDEQLRLWAWAQTTDWEFIDHQEKGMTLTKREGFEKIVWRPEE